MGGMSILTPDLRAEWGITQELLARARRGALRRSGDLPRQQVGLPSADRRGGVRLRAHDGHGRHGGHLQVRNAVQPAGGGDPIFRNGPTSSRPPPERISPQRTCESAAQRTIALERSYNAREGMRRSRRLPVLPLVGEEARGTTSALHDVRGAVHAGGVRSHPRRVVRDARVRSGARGSRPGTSSPAVDSRTSPTIWPPGGSCPGDRAAGVGPPVVWRGSLPAVRPAGAEESME